MVFKSTWMKKKLRKIVTVHNIRNKEKKGQIKISFKQKHLKQKKVLNVFNFPTHNINP